MNYLVAFVFALLPSILIIVNPFVFVVFAVFTGPFPAGYLEVIQTPVGDLSVLAVKLFGILLPVIYYVALHFQLVLRQLRPVLFHLIFLLYSSISLLWAPSIEFGLRGSAKLWAPLLFLCLVHAVVKNQKQLRQLASWMVGGGLLLIAVAVLFEALGYNRAIYFGPPGLGPSPFSMALVVILMLPAAAFFRRRAMLVNVCLMAVFSTAVFFAFTRITIAAALLAIGAIATLAARGWSRLFLLVAAAPMALILFFGTGTFKERMFHDRADEVSIGAVLSDPISVFEKVDSSGRFSVWSDLLRELFVPNPVLGAGVGATQDFLNSDYRPEFSEAHSDYVRLLCDTGLLGVFLFSLAAFSYLLRLWSLVRATRGEDGDHYPLAAFGGFLAYLAYLATDNGFDYVNAVGLPLFALIGMALVAGEISILARRASDPQTVNAARNGPRKPLPNDPDYSRLGKATRA